MKMKRQMKKVPAKSRQKLFRINMSNFFKCGIKYAVIRCQTTKVVQKKVADEFFIQKMTRKFCRFQEKLYLCTRNQTSSLADGGIAQLVRAHDS